MDCHESVFFVYFELKNRKGKYIDMKIVNSYLEAEEYLNEVPKFSQKNPMIKTKKFYEYLQNETDMR